MRVFITGLVGTLGSALARLHHARGDHVVGCSRSEARAVAWLRGNAHLGTLLVVDAKNVGTAMVPLAGYDRLYHCAALKHVDLCERQPCEAAYQNAWLADALAQSCEPTGCQFVLASTDKACLPQGVYGATKLIAERIAVARGGAAVRLGNLIGSSGSVFERWAEAAKKGEAITLTDPDMTRFFLGIDDAAAFMADYAEPGKVVAPDPLYAARMGDVATALMPGLVQVVGPRPGETRDQWLVAPGEPFREEADRLVIGEGDARGGQCSRDALRWDTKELLALAGLEV